MEYFYLVAELRDLFTTPKYSDEVRGNMAQKSGKLTANKFSFSVRSSLGNPYTNKGRFNCIYQLSAEIIKEILAI